MNDPDDSKRQEPEDSNPNNHWPHRRIERGSDHIGQEVSKASANCRTKQAVRLNAKLATHPRLNIYTRVDKDWQKANINKGKDATLNAPQIICQHRKGSQAQEKACTLEQRHL